MRKVWTFIIVFILIITGMIFPDALTAADYKSFNTVYNLRSETISVNWINSDETKPYTIYVNDVPHDGTGLVSYQFKANKNTLYIIRLVTTENGNNYQVGLGTIYTGVVSDLKVKLTNLNVAELSYSKVDNASGYYIYRGTNNKNYKLHRKIYNKDTNKFVDNNLKFNNKYYYKVLPFYEKKGVNYLGYTISEKNVFTSIPVTVSGFHITQANYNTNKLSWNKQNGITGYKIYYSTKQKGKYKKIANTKNNYFNHTGLKLNKRYYYKVVSYKTINGINNYGKYSVIRAKKIKLVKPVLNVNVAKKNSLKLSFSKTKYANYYEIYRATPNSKYIKIKTTNSTSYRDKNVLKYKTYYYKVRAVRKQKKKLIYSKFSSADYETSGERNVKKKLNLVSSYGDNEAYHPDVLYFEKGWHGYKYWLAFTPYPNIKGSGVAGDYTKENPHIRASNDMKHWMTPSLEGNPLDEPSLENNKVIYNSDNDLVYNKMLNRIECFWRTYTSDTTTLYMKYTSNGRNWSEKVKVYEMPNTYNTLLSPAIIYENGKYKMWFVQNWEVKYKEFNSVPFDKPISEKNVKISGSDHFVYPWHLDVIKVKGKYRMIYVGTTVKDHLRHMSLYYEYSNNGVDFKGFTRILNPSKDRKAWDNRGIYRSSFFYKDGKYYIFYSASNKNNEKGIGLVSGKKINDLYPVFTK